MEKLCEPKPVDILEALIGDKLTDETRLRNYMICHEFQLLLVENGGAITKTYDQIAVDFDLSTRQVERIVGVWRKTFSSCKPMVYDGILKKVG